jgi:MFS family permease
LGALDALVATSLIWFLAKFLRYAFPPLFGTFQAEYGLSNAALGVAFAAMMFFYAAMQFPSGVLADRIGSVRVIAAGAAVAALAALLVAAATVGGVPVLAAGMLLVGVGTGAHKTVAVALMPAVYPDRRGRVIGTYDTFGTFGGAAAPAAVVAVLGAAVGWEWLFIVAAAAGAASVVLFLRYVPRRLPESDPDSEVATDGSGRGVRRYLTMFTDWRLLAFVVVTALFAFAYNGIVAFLPLYLTEETALGTGPANLLYSGLFLVSVVQPVTGEASDRIGQLPVIFGTLLLSAASLVVLLATDASPVVAAAVLLLGVGSHGYRPVRGAYLVSVVPDGVAGGTLGIVRTVIMAAGAVSPAVVGLVADRAGFGPAFALLGVAIVAAAVVVLGLLVR